MTEVTNLNQNRINPEHRQHLAAVELLHQLTEEAAEGTGPGFGPLQWMVGITADLYGTPPPGPYSQRLKLLTMWADNLGINLAETTTDDGRTVRSGTTTMTNLYDQNVTVTLRMEK
jgi:hypothetical protein